MRVPFLPVVGVVEHIVHGEGFHIAEHCDDLNELEVALVIRGFGKHLNIGLVVLQLPAFVAVHEGLEPGEVSILGHPDDTHLHHLALALELALVEALAEAVAVECLAGFPERRRIII